MLAVNFDVFKKCRDVRRNVKNTNKLKNNQTKYRTTSKILFERFKLETPRLYTKSPRKQISADYWQSTLYPKPTETAVFDTQLTTQISQQSTPETQPEDLYELLHYAPDNYFTKQPTQPKIDSNSKIHHATKNRVTVKNFCNDKKQPLLDEDLTEHKEFEDERNLSYLPISTSLTLKRKRHMYYFPMDFEKLTLDGLIDTGALISAISEQDINLNQVARKRSYERNWSPTTLPNYGGQWTTRGPIWYVLA